MPATAIEQRFPRPSVMGVVNVTPDSFSDGGVRFDAAAAAAAAREMLADGAAIVDVGAEPALADLVAESGAYLCLMHMQGTPRTMQIAPRYDDVVADVARFLEERLA